MIVSRCVSRAALAGLMAIALGCGGKNDGGSPAAQPLPTQPVDTSPTFTIVIRDPEAGEKIRVVQNQSKTMEFAVPGDTAKPRQSNKLTMRIEFTETIVGKPPGAGLPTKLTRHYQVAELIANGQKPEVEPYQGKTVIIEKNPEDGKSKSRYSYRTEDGQPVLLTDSVHFERGDLFRIQDVLPKAAVKVGEPWTPDAAGIAKLFTALDLFNVDMSQSSVTGKLLKTYTENGRPWGEIEIAIKAIDPDGTGTGRMVLNAPIDGSSPERTQKFDFSAATHNQELLTTLAISETRKPVK